MSGLLFAFHRVRARATVYRFTERAFMESLLQVLEGKEELHRIRGSSSRVGGARMTRITRSISRGFH